MILQKGSNLGISLTNLLNLCSRLFYLVVQLWSQLTLLFNLPTHIVSLSLCDIIGLEGESLLFKTTCPQWDHLCEAAWSVGSRKNCCFSHALWLDKNIDAVIDLRKHVVGLKGHVVFTCWLGQFGKLLQTFLISIAWIKEKHTVVVVALLKALFS